VTLTNFPTGVAGASWGPDGFIYVDGQFYVSLARVEAKEGAIPSWFTKLDSTSGEVDHSWPDALPNGKGVIFTVTFGPLTADGCCPRRAIAVAEIPSGKHRIIVNGAIAARYASSGHLLYVTTNRTLMVVPFDQESMAVTGEPIALVEGIRVGKFGSSDLGVSSSGTLLYSTGEWEGKRELAWVARDGSAQSVDPGWEGDLIAPALSPDGKRLAVARRIGGLAYQIWIKQLDRGPDLKLTLAGMVNNEPTWTPDGGSVTFSSVTSDSAPVSLWTKRADGTGQAVLQRRDSRAAYNPRWSPDVKWLIYHTDTEMPGSGDIVAIRPGSDTTGVPLVATKFTETSPAISPDGRWLAFSSNETGEFEAYVVPFPRTSGAKWAVSTHGGTEPEWSHSGRELFYRDAAKNLVAVEVGTHPIFSLGRSTVLFSCAAFYPYQSFRYAVAPDDRRFLMVRPEAATAADRVIVVDNWFEELKEKSAH
jgi:serine/threonine-protein kinase